MLFRSLNGNCKKETSAASMQKQDPLKGYTLSIHAFDSPKDWAPFKHISTSQVGIIVYLKANILHSMMLNQKGK